MEKTVPKLSNIELMGFFLKNEVVCLTMNFENVLKLAWLD